MRVGSRNGEGACQYVQAKSRFSCDRVGSPPVHLSRFLLHSKHYPSLEGLQSPTPLYSNKWSTVSFGISYILVTGLTLHLLATWPFRVPSQSPVSYNLHHTCATWGRLPALR